MPGENTEENGPEVTVTDVGGTQSVQIDGNAKGQEQVEGDKANQITTPPASNEERPEGLPEGYDTWEEFGKAQLAEAQKNTQGEEEGAAEEEALTEEQKAQVQADLEQFPEDVREKATPFVEEVARTGSLSDASKEEAAKTFNVPVSYVDTYLKGLGAEAAATAEPILAEVGGKEVFDQFKEWAEVNYDAEQLKAFNAGLEKDPAKTVKEAVTAWKEQGNGPAPRDLTQGQHQPNKDNAQKVVGYASTAEMERDMNDRRYSTDAAFRAKVEQKVAASDFNLSRAV